MSFIDEKGLLSAQTRRFAVKKFDRNRSIPDGTWKTLEECIRLSPSSYNLQPWKFIVITDDALKKSLRQFSFNQEQIETCSHLVVICARKNIDEAWVERLLMQISKTTGATRESLQPHRDIMETDIFGIRKDAMFDVNIYQCYLALGNLMTSAALLGIDTCPIEGFINSRYDEVLKIAGTEWRSSVLCAVGYRRNDTVAPVRVRFPNEDIFDHRD